MSLCIIDGSEAASASVEEIKKNYGYKKEFREVDSREYERLTKEYVEEQG